MQNYPAALKSLASQLSELTMPSVQEAMERIESEQLNKIRCILTGAPYATVASEEIRLTLSSYAGADLSITADNLLDRWDLNLLTMCSRVSPALTNRQSVTLSDIARGDSPAGYARLLTFYMTRFFFSAGNASRNYSTKSAVERLHFAIDWHDFLVTLDLDMLRRFTLRLAFDDGWLALHDWHKLGLFSLSATKNGIMSPSMHKLRSWTLNPSAMDVNIKSFTTFIYSLTSMLVASEALNMIGTGVGGVNRESLKVSRLVSDMLGVDQEPVTQEVDSLNSELFESRRIYQETLTGRKIEVTWSATHGRGYKPGEAGPKRRVPVVKPKKESAEKLTKVKVEKPRTEKAKRLNALIDKINFTFNMDGF